MNSLLRSSNVSEFGGSEPASCKICSSYNSIRLREKGFAIGNSFWGSNSKYGSCVREGFGGTYLILSVICKSSCKELGFGKRSQ